MKNKLYYILIIAISTLSASLHAQGIKISYKNGKVIEATALRGFTPTSFDAITRTKEGYTKIFRVYYKELTPELQKHFNYNKKKAGAYNKKRRATIIKKKKEAEEKHLKKQEDHLEYNRLRNYVASRALYAQFYVIYSYNNSGVYVKAKAPDSLVRKGKYGRLYIADFSGTRGVSFTRSVYPCGKTINFNGYIGVPLYACSVDLAVKILKDQIRNKRSNKPTPLQEAYGTREVAPKKEPKKEVKEKESKE